MKGELIMKELQKKKPTLAQALTPIIFMVVALALGYGVFKIKAEPIIICSAFIAGIIALRLGYTWNISETLQKQRKTRFQIA